MFKDDIIDDIDNVFFDDEEFASIHTIDGVEMMAVVHEYSEAEAAVAHQAMKAVYNKKEHAIDEMLIHIHIKVSDYNEKLKPRGRMRLSANSMINLDGHKLFVQKYEENGGVLDVMCTRYQG